jgi:hypothetical protein
MSKETIEEAATNLANPNICETANWISGANWQADRMYSEEQVLELLNKVMRKYSKYAQHFGEYVDTDAEIKMYLEQLKKK